MYSYSVSQRIALATAMVSVAPFLSLFSMLTGGQYPLGIIPPSAWYFYLGGGWLLLLWVTVVYRVVVLYLSLSYEVGHAESMTRRFIDRLVLGGVFRLTLSARTSESTPRKVVFQPTAANMVYLSAIVGVIGSLSIASCWELIAGQASSAPQLFSSWRLALAAVIVLAFLSPIAETLIMAGILESARRRWGESNSLPLLSGFGWGGLHALVNDPSQFLPMTWLFWILSSLYLQSRRQRSFMMGYATTCAAHALNNSLILLLIAVRQALF